MELPENRLPGFLYLVSGKTRGGKCIEPRDHWSQTRKYFKFQKKKRVFGWPDINVNFSLAENIFNLRMAKTDALINRTPPPSTPWRNVGDI